MCQDKELQPTFCFFHLGKSLLAQTVSKILSDLSLIFSILSDFQGAYIFLFIYWIQIYKILLLYLAQII